MLAVGVTSCLNLWIILLACSLRVYLEFMTSFVLGLSSWTEITGPTQPEVFALWLSMQSLAPGFIPSSNISINWYLLGILALRPQLVNLHFNNSLRTFV